MINEKTPLLSLLVAPDGVSTFEARRLTLEEIYEIKTTIPSDINEHLPTLKKYSEECEHITEMGVRWAVSTFAFMMARPNKLISIDINPLEVWGNDVCKLKNLAKDNGVDFNFICASTLDIEIEETDFLFLDTDHSYLQLKSELALHADKARKYIGFHDTTTYELVIWQAIQEFLDANPHWVISERFHNNNGLTILKRVAPTPTNSKLKKPNNK